MINDDFCDCPDMSDEPGTSACPVSTFHCKNLGSFPKDVRSSIVNDGRCDCCDGSDEWKTEKCENECMKEAKENYLDLREYVVGLKHALNSQQELKQKAINQIEAKKQRLSELDGEISIKTAERDTREKERDAADAVEKE